MAGLGSLTRDLTFAQQPPDTMKRLFLPIVAMLLAITQLSAQSNEGGTFHIGLGWSLGIHSTNYEQEYTVGGVIIRDDDQDAAITRTFPIDLQIGVAKALSLGLYGEFGRYLDSSDTRSNRILIVGFAPRVYIINKDKFNWMIGPEIGISGLQIEDVEFSNKKFTDSYAGLHVRLATGISFYFVKNFGLQFQTRYAYHNMQWRDRDPENTAFDALDYQGVLTTSGIQLTLGATVKF